MERPAAARSRREGRGPRGARSGAGAGPRAACGRRGAGGGNGPAALASGGSSETSDSGSYVTSAGDDSDASSSGSERCAPLVADPGGYAARAGAGCSRGSALKQAGARLVRGDANGRCRALGQPSPPGHSPAAGAGRGAGPQPWPAHAALRAWREAGRECHFYAYAPPTAAALAALAARAPLVEVGAGTGYWARCLRGAGAAVAAYDAAPPGPRGAANAYHGRVPAVSQARTRLGYPTPPFLCDQPPATPMVAFREPCMWTQNRVPCCCLAVLRCARASARPRHAARRPPPLPAAIV